MKKIPGINASITDDLQVFSHRLNRTVSQVNDKDGYKLCKIDGVMHRVHRLIAKAYHGDSDLIVNHKNGIKHDNRPCNLEWCTPSYNNRHAIITGLATMKSQQESNERRKKFSDDDVLYMRDHFGVDENYNTLARKYGVSRGVIYQIINLITYKEVTRNEQKDT